MILICYAVGKYFSMCIFQCEWEQMLQFHTYGEKQFHLCQIDMLPQSGSSSAHESILWSQKEHLCALI